MSSARAVRCRLKCHNERNPCRQLPSRIGGHSDGTAIARCEEGGDDVKSARPLRPGLHTCYNGGHSAPLPGDGMRIVKSPLSSDWSLQPDSTKLDSLVIAHQPWRGEYVPSGEGAIWCNSAQAKQINEHLLLRQMTWISVLRGSQRSACEGAAILWSL